MATAIGPSARIYRIHSPRLSRIVLEAIAGVFSALCVAFTFQMGGFNFFSLIGFGIPALIAAAGATSKRRAERRTIQISNDCVIWDKPDGSIRTEPLSSVVRVHNYADGRYAAQFETGWLDIFPNVSGANELRWRLEYGVPSTVTIPRYAGKWTAARHFRVDRQRALGKGVWLLAVLCPFWASNGVVRFSASATVLFVFAALLAIHGLKRHLNRLAGVVVQNGRVQVTYAGGLLRESAEIATIRGVRTEGRRTYLDTDARSIPIPLDGSELATFAAEARRIAAVRFDRALETATLPPLKASAEGVAIPSTYS